MDYVPVRSICYRSMIMALILVLVGVVSQFNVFSDGGPEDWRGWLHSVSGMFLLAFGILMLLPRHRNIMSAIGLMCLGIGLSRLVVSISYTLQRTNVYNVSGLASLGLGLFGYVTMWFAAYQIYRGYNFLRGNAMNAFIMRFTSMGIVIMYVLVVIYANEFIGVSYETLWHYRSDFITSPLLYTMYFILLCSREAFDYMAWEKTRISIVNVAVPVNPGMLTISESESKRLMSYQEPGSWCSIEDGSPVEKELRIVLNASGRTMDLVLRKWHDSEKVYVALVPGNGREFISAIRGILTGIETDDGRIMLLGEKYPIVTLYPDSNRSGRSLRDIISKKDQSDVSEKKEEVQ